LCLRLDDFPQASDELVRNLDLGADEIRYVEDMQAAIERDMRQIFAGRIIAVG